MELGSFLFFFFFAAVKHLLPAAFQLSPSFKSGLSEDRCWIVGHGEVGIFSTMTCHIKYGPPGDST